MRVFSAVLLAATLACAVSHPSYEANGGSVKPSVNGGAFLPEGEEALARAQWPRAEALLAAADAAEPSARTAGLRARAIFEQGRFEEALAAARASLARGETAEARFVEGRVLAKQRKLEDAARAYERCVELDPRRADGWASVVALRLTLGDQARAEQAYAELERLVPPLDAEDRAWTAILGAQPDPFQLQEGLDRCARGTAAYLARRYGEAAHEMLSVIGTMQRFAHCWSELGKAEWKLGRPDDAEVAFRRALDAYRPDQAGLRADTEGLLAALLVERGRAPAEAIRLARASLSVRGDRPATLDALGRACELASDAACARESWARLAASAAAPDASRARAKERLEKLRD